MSNERDLAMINQNNLILVSFGIMVDTGRRGIILRGDPAGHCFVLRALIIPSDTTSQITSFSREYFFLPFWTKIKSSSRGETGQNDRLILITTK